MLPRPLANQKVLSSQNSRLNVRWLIVGLFTMVLLLEYATLPSYVFGYLYIGPILLANSRLGRMICPTYLSNFIKEAAIAKLRDPD